MASTTYSALRIRSNFLLSLAAFMGLDVSKVDSLPTVIDRKTLVDWERNCTNPSAPSKEGSTNRNVNLPVDVRGECDLPLKWPSWLTNNPANAGADRGTYVIDWSVIAEYRMEKDRRDKARADAQAIKKATPNRRGRPRGHRNVSAAANAAVASGSPAPMNV